MRMVGVDILVLRRDDILDLLLRGTLHSEDYYFYVRHEAGSQRPSLYSSVCAIYLPAMFVLRLVLQRPMKNHWDSIRYNNRMNIFYIIIRYRMYEIFISFHIFRGALN